MTQKIGRNEACPCGSGRKYKHCCLHPQASQKDASAAEPKAHEDAIGRAITWLFDHHAKAVQVALNELLKRLLGDQRRDGLLLDEEDEESWVGIQINLMEWLIAQGQLQIKGVKRRTCEYLLGSSGMLLSVEQRQWLEQLMQRPLRLYDVTDVVPDVGMTLCDALDTDAPPVVVRERAGTRLLTPGMQLGCRVMRVEEHFELSGAAYPFSMLAGPAVAAKLRDRLGDTEFDSERNAEELHATLIMTEWLRQYVEPPSVPMLMDAHSQEPIRLTMDHYQVCDWRALIDALAACPDVRGNREKGWERLIECEDGLERAIATVSPGERADRITVFYKTWRHAHEGRAWFDGVAGAAVKFLNREVHDPRSLMARSASDADTQMAKPTTAKYPPSIEPYVLSQAIAATLQRIYAHWADAPIPALGDKSPREAMHTPAGLERVKGLIRSYEAGEQEMARQQGREAASFDFLWQAVGLKP